mmetsp:Transcript_24747/g.43295  ORF Transcript_24747/g.43295 Transcript_24747/m.43295 type:complete len:82 (+) Transcript_24747:1489-1734(+)
MLWPTITVPSLQSRHKFCAAPFHKTALESGAHATCLPPATSDTPRVTVYVIDDDNWGFRLTFRGLFSLQSRSESNLASMAH